MHFSHLTQRGQGQNTPSKALGSSTHWCLFGKGQMLKGALSLSLSLFIFQSIFISLYLFVYLNELIDCSTFILNLQYAILIILLLGLYSLYSDIYVVSWKKFQFS